MLENSTDALRCRWMFVPDDGVEELSGEQTEKESSAASLPRILLEQ